MIKYYHSAFLKFMKKISIILILLLNISVLNISVKGQSSIIFEAARKMNINNQTSNPYNDASDSKFLPSFSNDYKIGYRYHFRKINSYTELSFGYFSIKQKAIVAFSDNFANFKPVSKSSSFGKIELHFLKPLQNGRVKLRVGLLATIDRFFAKPFSRRINMKADFSIVDSAYAEIDINEYALDSRAILICGLTAEIKQFKYGSFEIGITLRQGFKSIETLDFIFYAYGKNSLQRTKIGHVISLTNGQSISVDFSYLIRRNKK